MSFHTYMRLTKMYNEPKVTIHKLKAIYRSIKCQGRFQSVEQVRGSFQSSVIKPKTTLCRTMESSLYFIAMSG